MIYKKHRKTTMSLHKTTIFLKCKKQRKGRNRETDKAERDRETERQRDRETGRQRETERQKRQRDRETSRFL